MGLIDCPAETVPIWEGRFKPFVGKKLNKKPLFETVYGFGAMVL